MAGAQQPGRGGQWAVGRPDRECGVADQLKLIGVVPVHIAAAKVEVQSQSEGWWQRINRKPVVDEDLMIFSRQMYTLNKAGVPILRAFSGLQASASKPAMVDLLKDIRSSLDQGRELSAAMARIRTCLAAFIFR
jgi:MSHA biogenesis protein MshG